MFTSFILLLLGTALSINVIKREGSDTLLAYFSELSVVRDEVALTFKELPDSSYNLVAADVWVGASTKSLLKGAGVFDACPSLVLFTHKQFDGHPFIIKTTMNDGVDCSSEDVTFIMRVTMEDIKGNVVYGWGQGNKIEGCSWSSARAISLDLTHYCDHTAGHEHRGIGYMFVNQAAHRSGGWF